MRLGFEFPDAFPETAMDLIKKLVVIDPSQRLGASETQGYDELKKHPFFDSISWTNLSEQTPPI